MPMFNIAYDILNEGGTQDYEPLWQELKALGAHAVQDGLWVLEFEGGLQTLAKRVSELLDAGDRLFIAEVHHGEYYHRNSRAGASGWLSARREAINN